MSIRSLELPIAAALAAALLVAAPVTGAAAEVESIPVPSQEEWADAKERAPAGTGVDLAYVRMGAAEGEPILLIHGYSDNSRSWSLLAPHLADRPLYAVDLRGHGASDAPECCYGADTLAADIAGLMDRLEIEKADVIGHSLGAMTATALAATRPDKVDHLVLVSGALSADAGPGSWIWDNIRNIEAPIDPAGEFMTSWYASPNPVDPDFLEREMAESAAMPIAAWQGVLDGLAMLDLTRLAATIEAPTLILWGDQDELFEATSQEQLRAALPDARFEVFEGFGHNMFWESPEKTASVIKSFLTEQTAPR